MSNYYDRLKKSKTKEKKKKKKKKIQEQNDCEVVGWQIKEAVKKFRRYSIILKQRALCMLRLMARLTQKIETVMQA